MFEFPSDGLISTKAEAETRLLVRLPAHMKDFYKEVGYERTIVDEQRSNARLRVRCEATIESTYTPPFLARKEKCALVLVKDLSRSGIAILHYRQMFPTEQFAIKLHDRKLTATVVRARKLGDCCYEVGAKIDSIEVPRTDPSQS